MNEADQNRRRLLQAGGLIGSAAMMGGAGLMGISPRTTAAETDTGTLPLPEYDTLDVTAMASMLRGGELTALELVDAAIARFNSRSAINALAVDHFDRAREQAKLLSRVGRVAREGRMAKAPLLGVPFALKDLSVKMKGTVTTNGSVFFKDAVADYDSTLVERYQQAGLNIMAKLTSPEFGQTATTESQLHGDTLNPWNLEYSSGGSSGGSAAAVAARILPAAHASDGGGSIRIPSSHCGLFGLKPSRGRVPAGPDAIEGWMGLSVQNVVTRSVRDSALLLQLTQGTEPGSRVRHRDLDLLAAISRPPQALRIAVMKTHPFGLPVHQDCLDALDNTIKLLTELGHEVVEAFPALPIEGMFKGMGVATSTGLLRTVQARESALGRAVREDELEPINWMHLQNAKTYTSDQVYAARSAFDEGGQQFDRFFTGYDLLLTPVTIAPPPKIGDLRLDQPFEDFVSHVLKASPITSLFNMTGLPAMSVPLHWNQQGLPIGVQFAGPYGAEDRLLSLAAQLEKAVPWADKLPPLVQG
ncbi:amidase [Amphritea sp. HPY]|uniref:amidase n=1 Tax=Amphritea sp. HPY TaxID=3421652 RepID=UPI003D7F0CA9